MTRVTLDEPLKIRLKGLTDQVELCDENGEVVGHVLPDGLYKQLIYDIMKAQRGDEELIEALNESGGSSLSDILARLESE